MAASMPERNQQQQQRLYTESELRKLNDAAILDLVRETITQLDMISNRLKSQLHDEGEQNSDS